MAITISKVENNQLGEPIEFDLKGLSTDTPKPTTVNDFPVGVNSLFLELDTGKFYYFDGSDWNEVGA